MDYNIGFIGAGKLGLPCAEVMADSNCYVEAYDTVKFTSDSVIQVDSIKKVVENKSIVFIAVPTPHDPKYGGELPTSHMQPVDFDYTILKEVVAEADKHMNSDQVLVIISTVLPGTIRRIIDVKNPMLVYNPYLIAMGTVKWDMLNPEMVIMGSDNSTAIDFLEQFYVDIIGPEIRTASGTIEEAESIKIFYNTYISMKLSFVNMVMDVSDRIGNCDVDVITNALAKSTKRITGKQYLTAGMGDGGACFVPDTPVMTENGPIEIQDIQIGDRVLSEGGILSSVSAIHKNKHSKISSQYDGSILKIKSMGSPPIEVTPDHEIYIAKDTRKKYTTGGKSKFLNSMKQDVSLMTSNIVKIKADQLEVGDYVLYPIPQEINVTLPDYVTDEYIKLAGYYVAEGSVDGKVYDKPNRTGWMFHEDETEYHADVIELVEALVNKTPKIQDKKDSKALSLRVSSPDLTRNLVSDFGRTSYNKTIPSWLIFGNEDNIKFLLRGMFRGDGHSGPNGFSYSTTSKNLAYGVQQMLFRLGIMANLRDISPRVGNNDGVYHRRAYEVRIRNSVCLDKLSQILGMPNNHQMQDKKYPNKNFIKDGMVYRKITSIEQRNYTGDVYTLTVDDTHNYVVPIGLVSNCHPRDNIALKTLSERMNLGYDLFGAIMDTRERQAENLARKLCELSVEHNLPIAILGVAYKPGVEYTDGSYSILVEHYCKGFGATSVRMVDPISEGYEREITEPSVILMAHDSTTTYAYTKATDTSVYEVDIPDGSVVVDPWRKYENDQCEVYYYGNSRDR